MVTVAHIHKNRFAVYIGRAYSMMPQSPFHNPFHIGKDGNREEVLLKFAVYWYAPEQKSLRVLARNTLAYCTLGCWCAPRRCHGDIIAGYINWREVMECPTQL